MRVGFYQFSPAFGKKEENLKKVFSSLEHADLDLLVLPEFFATGYRFVSKDEVAELSEEISQGATTEALSELSRKKGVILRRACRKEMESYFSTAL